MMATCGLCIIEWGLDGVGVGIKREDRSGKGHSKTTDEKRRVTEEICPCYMCQPPCGRHSWGFRMGNIQEVSRVPPCTDWIPGLQWKGKRHIPVTIAVHTFGPIRLSWKHETWFQLPKLIYFQGREPWLHFSWIRGCLFWDNLCMNISGGSLLSTSYDLASWNSRI